MKNDLTELVFILDRSGSMGGLESDTVGGFNAMLRKQKEGEGKALVTTVLFDNGQQRLHDRLPLEEVPPMTGEDYAVGGCTALLDAIGDTVTHIAEIHRYARPEDVPARTLFAITTDGMENASRRWSGPEVKRLIQQKKELGWEFLFIGANIDAVAAAATVGIASDRAVNYRADKKGTRVVYDNLAKVVASARAAVPLQADWAEEINADYQSRK